MILYPAIDILEGRAVRLVRGDFAASKVYDADPLQAARRFAREGAQRLHVVDLDGARRGAPVNLAQVRRIAAELDIPIQLGGGLRSRQAIADALAAGAARVILGTAALTDPALLADALARHGAGRVLVAVDARGGQVVTDGWRTRTQRSARELVRDLVGRGVGELLYTDVDRDGMLEGIGQDAVRAVAGAAGGGRLIYSGGVGSLEDLRALAALRAPALAGVVVGKALYEGRFTVAEAQAALA